MFLHSFWTNYGPQAGDVDIQTMEFMRPFGVVADGRSWASLGKHGRVFKSDLSNGSSIIYNFSNGMLDGEQIHTSVTQTNMKTTYDNNKLKTLEVFSSNNGHVTKKTWTCLYNDNDEVTGWICHCMDNSNSVLYYEEYDMTGIISGTYFDKRGNIISEIINGNGDKILLDAFDNPVYRASVKDRLMICEYSFYANTDKIASIVSYEDGLMHGEAAFFSLDGSLLRSEMWANNMLNGTTKIFCEGVLVETIEFKSNMRHGTQMIYDRTGELQHKISWNKNAKHGESITFKENGIQEIKIFHNGDLASTKLIPSDAIES